MSAEPRLSVVIPTCGRPQALRETLASLLACEPAPEEVIVVDGDARCSAQPVLAELEGHRPHLLWLRAPRSSTGQRNRGIDAARGDVVVFLDDDVALAPDALGGLAAEYADPEVVGATGRVLESAGRRRGSHGSRLRRWLPGGGSEGVFTRFGYPRYVLRHDGPLDVEFMPGCFMSARREVAARVRFDERLTGYALAEDEDFSYRLSRLGRLRYLPDAIVRHHKLGFSSHDRHAFSRLVVVNRSYLFRKNFPQTSLARAQFGLFLALLIAHRLTNRDWAGARGTIEGILASWAGDRLGPKSGRDRRPPSLVVPAVTFVSSHAKAGGAERYLEVLLERLEPASVRCVVCLEQGPLVERLRRPVHVLPTSRHALANVASALRLRRLLLRQRPDVVHANGIKAALVAALATAGTGIPLVWLKHDVSRDGWLARLVAARCKQVIGVSEAVTRTFGRRARAKVSVIHNAVAVPAVDRGDARRRLLAALPGPPPTHVVALVGRLDPAKGHCELLAVLPRLRARLPGLRAAFVGGDDPAHLSYARALRREVSGGELREAVAFLGFRDDAVELLGGCDAIVIPSHEGFPYVALEALAVGTPVVAYAAGGTPDLVGDCGLLVPPGDSDALVEALSRVLEDRALRTGLAERGQARVRERFAFERLLADLTARYREAAA